MQCGLVAWNPKETAEVWKGSPGMAKLSAKTLAVVEAHSMSAASFRAQMAGSSVEQPKQTA